MKDNRVAEIIGRPILNPLGNLLLLGFIGIISSPFIWIWLNGNLALKVFITSVLVIIVCTILIKWIKKIVAETLEEHDKNTADLLNNTVRQKSKFQEKLNQKLKEHEHRNND